MLVQEIFIRAKMMLLLAGATMLLQVMIGPPKTWYGLVTTILTKMTAGATITGDDWSTFIIEWADDDDCWDWQLDLSFERAFAHYIVRVFAHIIYVNKFNDYPMQILDHQERIRPGCEGHWTNSDMRVVRGFTWIQCLTQIRTPKGSCLIIHWAGCKQEQGRGRREKLQSKCSSRDFDCDPVPTSRKTFWHSSSRSGKVETITYFGVLGEDFVDDKCALCRMIRRTWELSRRRTNSNFVLN